jgi:hypothetical protein
MYSYIAPSSNHDPDTPSTNHNHDPAPDSDTVPKSTAESGHDDTSSMISINQPAPDATYNHANPRDPIAEIHGSHTEDPYIIDT